MAQLAAKIGRSGDIERFVEAETAARRIFFKDKGDILRQLQKWRGPRLSRLVEKLIGLHRALLANSQQAELLLAQGLTEIARVAAPRK